MSGERDILERSATVAVVGASRDTSKPSGGVPAGLKERGFKVLPVNPKADEVLGVKAYASLGDIDEPIDVVEVFRPAGEAAAIAEEAVAAGAKVLWLQQGIKSEEARQIAERAGLEYVEDRCMGALSKEFDIRKA